MSSREKFSVSADDTSASSTVSQRPACPKCERRMAVRVVAPALLAADLDEVTYACESCSVEVELTVKRT
jgi:DNA-directed RNA polymerase subunit RPC12/RpoP